MEPGLLLENGDARLEVGGLDIGDQAPLEARAEPLFDLGDLLGRAVAGDDDLLARLVEVVEGVEELLLGAFLAREDGPIVVPNRRSEISSYANRTPAPKHPYLPPPTPQPSPSPSSPQHPTRHP